MALFQAASYSFCSVSQQSGNNLIRLNLDGSPSQNLGPCSLAMPTRMPEQSIDLRASVATADLWKPVAVDEAALAATQPAEAATGKLKLDELLKDSSADDKAFAEQAYEFASTNTLMSNFYDPVKVAMKALDAHKADPKAALSSLMVTLDLSGALDRDRITQYGHDHALGMLGGDGKLTDDQKNRIPDQTGPALADAFFKQPKPDIRGIETLFQKVFTSARASIAGGASQAANTPAPQPQANSQQGNQTGQSNPSPQQSNPSDQPPQQSTAQSQSDKAAKKAKKAKDAADKLRGLLGH